MTVALARGIRKSFGRAEVLRGVTLELRAGEVHALAGENGAGKSTLIKILAGAHADFEGELVFCGDHRRFATPIEARRAGVATIHQELSLVGAMSVADNLTLGREPRGRFGLVDARRQRSEAERLLEAFRLDVDPETPVEALPIATQQLIEIAKALGEDARLFIFDEPTSALDDAEAELLFAQIARLRQERKAILFVSHRMEDIYRIADRITVLRDGENAVTATAAELTRGELVRAMLGRERTRGADAGAGAGADANAASGSGSGERARARARLEVQGLSVPDPGTQGRLEVVEASFSIAEGEIVGLTGLRGSGASGVLEGIYGARGAVTGSVALDGVPVEVRSPARALALGIALLPSDRRRAGIVPALSVVENATLGSLDRFARGPWLRPRVEREAMEGLVEPLRLGRVRLEAEVGTLSGGSQQKVCLARCLLAEPRVLLVDEPTRGVDVGAKADIHALLRRLAAKGAAILFFTSELEELLALADRILVLFAGRLISEIPRAEASRARILADAMGGEARARGGEVAP